MEYEWSAFSVFLGRRHDCTTCFSHPRPLDHFSLLIYRRMGRQSTCRLVLLLAVTLCAIQASHSTALGGPSVKYIKDDILDNELTSGEETSPGDALPKISTPKVKELPAETTTKSPPKKKSTPPSRETTISEEALKDLMEAAKHSQILGEDPHFNKMLEKENATVSESSGKSSNSSEDNYSDDDIDDDYDYNYNYDDDKETTTAAAKKDASKSTTTTKPKLQPIMDSTSSSPKVTIHQFPGNKDFIELS